MKDLERQYFKCEKSPFYYSNLCHIGLYMWPVFFSCLASHHVCPSYDYVMRQSIVEFVSSFVFQMNLSSASLPSSEQVRQS